MLRWRRECPLLGRESFMTGEDITWWESNWDDDESRFLAFSLHDRWVACLPACMCTASSESGPINCTLANVFPPCQQGCVQSG